MINLLQYPIYLSVSFVMNYKLIQINPQFSSTSLKHNFSVDTLGRCVFYTRVLGVIIYLQFISQFEKKKLKEKIFIKYFCIHLKNQFYI